MNEYLVLGSIFFLLGLLISGKIEAYRLFVALAFFYYLLGWVTLDSLLSNFINSALITLMSLLLVSHVIEKTHWVQKLGQRLFSGGLITVIGKMGFFVGLSSAVLNNTAVVATLMSSAGKNSQHPPSKLLIPLSFIAILGGTLTLIGTSTHLIINSFVVQSGLEELAMFDFFSVGLFLLLSGLLVLWTLAPKLLPDIQAALTQKHDYFIEAKLLQDSSLIGKTITQAGLRHLEELFLVQVISGGESMAPVSPNYCLKSGDRLAFVGDLKAASKLLLLPGVILSGASNEQSVRSQFIEVVVSHQSSLVGRTLKSANFRNKFDAAAVAIRRGREEIQGRLSDTELKAGDTLVLMAGREFEKRENLQNNFYFYSKVNLLPHLSQKQSLGALSGFIAVIALAVLEWLPLVKGLLILLALYLIFGLTSVQEIRRRFPFDLYFIIGSALAIASVMMESGAAQLLAEGVLWLFNDLGLWGMLIGIYLLTLILTELITNNAAAALSFPIALSSAQALDVSVWPFIMVVAYGASASFLTPYGYQTNLMVYGPGGYRFGDYFKMGLPVSLVYGFVVIGLVPVFFPF